MAQKLDVFKLRTRLPSLVPSRTIAKAAGVKTTADLHMDDVLVTPGVTCAATEIVAVCR